jgi:hypothetical protein
VRCSVTISVPSVNAIVSERASVGNVSKRNLQHTTWLLGGQDYPRNAGYGIAVGFIAL